MFVTSGSEASRSLAVFEREIPRVLAFYDYIIIVKHKIWLSISTFPTDNR